MTNKRAFADHLLSTQTNAVLGGQSYACNCTGPRTGEPFCPCMMRGMIQRDGRWIRPERDCGPARSTPSPIDPLNVEEGL